MQKSPSVLQNNPNRLKHPKLVYIKIFRRPRWITKSK